MKKTYFAPTCEIVVLHSNCILAHSMVTNSDVTVENAGWSKEITGSFWDDESNE